MVNKRSGQVDYAVLQFGGLFGIGSDYYPIPWRQLRYSPDHGGYIVSVDRTALDKAPRYSAPDDQDFDTAYGREVTNYYSSYPPI